MGIKKGTKLTDMPKNLYCQVRIDEETNKQTQTVCEVFGYTKSQAIREGIKELYRQAISES